MEEQPQPQKEPQDSIKKEQLDSVQEAKDTETISDEANQKMMEEKDIIMKEEKEKKYNKNDILQEALDQKSISIINFANELDNILTSINTTWENYRDGYAKYCAEEIRPKVNELLNYPCINSNREKVILIFSFFCKYILNRMNFLKEISKDELYIILTIIYSTKSNLYSKFPNIGNNQGYELVDDKYFYIAFKEILPDKELENSYGANQFNCFYKYFLEFIFQSGFVEKYLNEYLTRDDILANEFGNVAYFPANLLYYCDKNFIQKKKWNIEIIKIINAKVNFYFSENNPYLKNDNVMHGLIYYLSIYYFDSTLGIFNFSLDELIYNNLSECQLFAILIFRINEYFLKHSKINFRMIGIQNINNLCDNYLHFLNKSGHYSDYIKKFDDAEKICQFLIQCGIEYMAKMNIFDYIFGENIHEGVIQRSYSILSLLYKTKIFNSNHIQKLWNLSLTKYQSISNAIISLFGNLLPEFSIEDCNSILTIVDKMPFKEVNDITLKLLENFFHGNLRHELLLKILFKFSNELSIEQGLDKDIIHKSRQILVRLLMNKNYFQDLFIYIKRSIFHLHKFYLFDTYFSVLSQILDYLSNSNNQNIYNNLKFDIEIKNFNILISYLDEKFKLFPVLMNLMIKVIKLFKFFYLVSTKVLEEIDKGNFDYDNLLNIDNLYNQFAIFNQNNMNFSYNLNNDNIIKDKTDNDMDIDTSNNNKINQEKDIYNLNIEFDKEINENEQNKYIKNLIQNYTQFFKNSLISKNILPSVNELKQLIFQNLKIDKRNISYNQYISCIIRFIFANIVRSNSNFKLDYIIFLFNIAQSITDIDPSLNWYYSLLNDIIEAKINKNQNNIIDDGTIQKLIVTQIQKNSNYETMPISAFNAALTFTIYANQKISNAIYSPLIQKFTEIKSFKNFWGFDIIWGFYCNTKNDMVLNAALNTIINILELISKSEEDRNHIINTIFNYINQNKNNISNHPEVKLVFIRSLKVISVILGTKINKDIFGDNNNNNNATIKVICKNHYFNSNNNEEQTINIFLHQKIKNLKEFIINYIICSERNLNIYNNSIKAHNESILNHINRINTIEEEKTNSDNTNLVNYITMDEFKKMVYNTNIIILHKNTVLKDDFTVADCHLEENSKLLIYKGGGNYEDEYIPSEEELQNGYMAIKTIFGENLYFGEDVMKAAIVKFKGNYEEAGLYLTDKTNVEIIQKEIEDKKSKLEQKKDDIICLDEGKINLMIEVLQVNDDHEILSQIWELFSTIKYPDNIIKIIIEENLDNILNINDLNKLILYLEIINSLIFDGDFCKYNKLNKEQKDIWISNFIRNEKLINKIFKILDKLNNNISSYHFLRVLKIFVGWLHKILYKICEVIAKIGNGTNILPEINMLRNLNSNDNNQNNENNDANNSNKDNGEFEINNYQDGINFLLIISNENGVIIFYKLISLVDKFVQLEEKQNLLQKMSEFILMGIVYQKNEIKKFCIIEKENNVLIDLIIFSQFTLVRRMIVNLLKILIRNLLPLTDQKTLEENNDIYTIIFQSFISKLLNGIVFNQELCNIFSFLLTYTTNNFIQKSIEPFIYKILANIFKFCNNLEKSDKNETEIRTYEIRVIYDCLKFYSGIIMNYINNKHNKNQYNYIQFLYDFLFSIQKDEKNHKINAYKFKDNYIRDILLNLLTELISLDGNYLIQLLPKIITHHKKIEKVDPNKIETPYDVNIRSSNEKLIGLRNFGSTCYLNSLTQQLFMMPTFRKDLFNNFIISTESKTEPDKLRYSVIYNLQLTFENLKNGCMTPYPPNRFIRSFLSAFNGEPIQFGIQQDSDEFLAILCDNLEKEAKSYNKENFLENSFKGKISNEILSLEKEYPYYSHGEEPFFRITLDIKGHKTLEEALDAYVKGEILDGDNKYYVDEYKRKISIRKSSSLKMLGNEVIIHLKRFEFDFVTFDNHKLSDYLKFPMKINFKKWTRAYLRLNDNENNKLSEDLLKITDIEKLNLIDENMEYILTGILVHGGSNIQSGHYYSYIMDQETGKWHQFNDNTISDYNIGTDLEKECFGNMGENNVNQYGRTAYLLFYTKKSVFRNKTLFENINVNQIVLNDVYNENVKFLNMNIYLNANYFNFLQKACKTGIPLLSDKSQTIEKKDLTLTNFLIKNYSIYQKIIPILKPENDDGSIDENILNIEENIEKTIANTKNFEQIYSKCKEEVDISFKLNKETDKKINNNFITKKQLIKLYFNYVFGLMFPNFHTQGAYNRNQNQELILQILKALVDIIKENQAYSLWILKQIEKNLPLFIDIIFRYGTTENELNDMAKLILEFFQLTFDYIYNFEKKNLDMTTDMISYLVRDEKNKIIIMKEHRSIIMRLFKKLFCDNLEKSRYEFSRSSLYLTIFYHMVQNYPEVSSITINYFFVLVSLISNNTLSNIKSEINPNYSMGNNSGYMPNVFYLLIFSDTILKCVTPGMIKTNTFSPFFTNIKTETEVINWSKYPKLPQNWEKILTFEFYINFLLNYNNARPKELTSHLCYGDEQVSVQILNLVCQFMKTKTFMPLIEKVFNNSLCVFDLKDNLELIRVDALFELNDKINEEPIDTEQNKILFEYLEAEKENSLKDSLLMLYSIGKSIEKYEVIGKYFDKNKNKIGWISTFINKIKTDPATKERYIKESGYILNQHPDLLEVIQNNLIKRFNKE